MDKKLSKTIKKIFNNSLTFECMYEAYKRAKKHKTSRFEVMNFEYHLEYNIHKLINEIKDGTYSLGKYRVFKVYEPKERFIKALPFKDRVVHQWYVYEFIIPYFVPKFIYDSYACLENKGTHKAVKRLSYFIKEARKKYQDFYIIKMDISKFFYNIDQNILFNIIKKTYNDKKMMNLTKLFIFDEIDDVGIPIGNYTSQYFANIYLNELDQYVKHELKIKYYLRYMDDFVLIVENKTVAKELFDKLNIFVENVLKLKLNHKSKIYPSKMGVDFCGYRVFYTHILLRNRSKIQMKKRIKEWNYLYKNDKLNIKNVKMSINSWKAHIKHANTYKLLNDYYKKLEFKIE